MISKNSKSLQTLTVANVYLEPKVLVTIGKCTNLKSLCFNRCHVSHKSGKVASMYENLSNLETLELIQFPFSRATAETISRCCRSLRSLKFIFSGVEDDELRLLVKGCPRLRYLKLHFTEVTDDSVEMLMNHRPRITAIAISDCEYLSWQSQLSLLRQVIIPAIFDETDPETQVAAMQVLCEHSSDHFFPQQRLADLVNTDSLLVRLVDLMSTADHLRSHVMNFFTDLVQRGYRKALTDVGALSPETTVGVVEVETEL
jgi:hypothetical protein